MGFRIRQIEAETKFVETITVEAITQIVALETIQNMVEECRVGENRVRQLWAALVVMLCITMNLFSELALTAVLRQLLRGARLLHTNEVAKVASKSAISQARYRLGYRVMERLFECVCQPIARPDTPGAFAYGLRLIALDGTVEQVPDTAENEAYFGRSKTGYASGPFPQVRGVYLCECGTHVIFDAVFDPYARSERHGGLGLLRSVEAGMLVMWDGGFHDFDMLKAVRQRGAQVLARLPANVKPQVITSLPDGSWLARLLPSEVNRRKAGEWLLVRVIEYTLDDPACPGYGQTHRLVTTLLDPTVYPALDLTCLFHQRWEIEVTVDELKTHQRLIDRPLRSHKPAGVLQELYGLLLAHFVVRSLMHQAAIIHTLDPDRLSFVGALRLIKEAVYDFQLIDPNDHPRLQRRLLNDIASHQLAQRDHRINPRVVKQRSKFPPKRPQHYHWPQPERSFRDAIVVLNLALPMLN